MAVKPFAAAVEALKAALAPAQSLVGTNLAWTRAGFREAAEKFTEVINIDTFLREEERRVFPDKRVATIFEHKTIDIAKDLLMRAIKEISLARIVFNDLQPIVRTLHRLVFGDETTERPPASNADVISVDLAFGALLKTVAAEFPKYSAPTIQQQVAQLSNRVLMVTIAVNNLAEAPAKKLKVFMNYIDSVLEHQFTTCPDKQSCIALYNVLSHMTSIASASVVKNDDIGYLISTRLIPHLLIGAERCSLLYASVPGDITLFLMANQRAIEKTAEFGDRFSFVLSLARLWEETRKFAENEFNHLISFWIARIRSDGDMESAATAEAITQLLEFLGPLLEDANLDAPEETRRLRTVFVAVCEIPLNVFPASCHCGSITPEQIIRIGNAICSPEIARNLTAPVFFADQNLRDAATAFIANISMRYSLEFFDFCVAARGVQYLTDTVIDVLLTDNPFIRGDFDQKIDFLHLTGKYNPSVDRLWQSEKFREQVQYQSVHAKAARNLSRACEGRLRLLIVAAESQAGRDMIFHITLPRLLKAAINKSSTLLRENSPAAAAFLSTLAINAPERCAAEGMAAWVNLFGQHLDDTLAGCLVYTSALLLAHPGSHVTREALAALVDRLRRGREASSQVGVPVRVSTSGDHEYHCLAYEVVVDRLLDSCDMIDRDFVIDMVEYCDYVRRKKPLITSVRVTANNVLVLLRGSNDPRLAEVAIPEEMTIL